MLWRLVGLLKMLGSPAQRLRAARPGTSSKLNRYHSGVLLTSLITLASLLEISNTFARCVRLPSVVPLGRNA